MGKHSGGSEIKNRKGLRGDDPKGQPVSQQATSGPKPKPMTSGEAKPASTWFK